MAGCVENLIAQLLGDFDRLKDLYRSSLENRVQDVVHDGPPFNVAITT
jgi:hypothetical protein